MIIPIKRRRKYYRFKKYFIMRQKSHVLRSITWFDTYIYLSLETGSKNLIEKCSECHNHKVDKKGMIRNRYNRIPYPALNTKREKDTYN